MCALLFKKEHQKDRGKLRSVCYLQKLTNASRTTEKIRKSSQFHAPLNSRIARLRCENIEQFKFKLAKSDMQNIPMKALL